eukprot:2557060-Pyramimonas_sp.AAC.1
MYCARLKVRRPMYLLLDILRGAATLLTSPFPQMGDDQKRVLREMREMTQQPYAAAYALRGELTRQCRRK